VIAAIDFVETMAGVGVVAGAVVGVMVLLEKVTGLLGRWVQRQVKDVIRPTEARVLHHLGENGTTVPMHHRMGEMEQTIRKIEQCPHLRGEEVA
jgi:uncharacterized membrane protein YqgA involved in biofilm formation